MLKIPIKLRHVSVPKVPSSGNTSSLAKVTIMWLDVLPEDGSLGTETCRNFIGIFSI